MSEETRATICCLECRLTQYVCNDLRCRRCRARVALPFVNRFFPKKELVAVEAAPVERAARAVRLPQNLVGEYLQFIRREFDLTQEQVARMARTPRTYVNRVENGAIRNVCARVAANLGVPFEHLGMDKESAAILFATERLVPERQQEILAEARRLGGSRDQTETD